jgi:hypothetical protein
VQLAYSSGFHIFVFDFFCFFFDFKSLALLNYT